MPRGKTGDRRDVHQFGGETGDKRDIHQFPFVEKEGNIPSVPGFLTAPGPNLMFKFKKKTKITSAQFEQQVKTSGQFRWVMEIGLTFISMKVCSAHVKDDSAS